MLFAGIDLAWSIRNNSAIAVIEGDRCAGTLKASRIVGDNQEILWFMKQYVGDEPALVAIDAPIVVPNQYGRRQAEMLIATLFAKYNAAAYPANRKTLASWDGKVRGEEISRLLQEAGFVHSPFIQRHEEARKFFEVYPHPACVVLFNLTKIIGYKARPKRERAFRYKEFQRYQECLRTLERSSPSLFLPRYLLDVQVESLAGRRLKDYEDLLDAIVCAYIAFYYWTNPAKCAVLGSMIDGYIVTPVFAWMKETLKTLSSK